jgi:hypothetical protein
MLKRYNIALDACFIPYHKENENGSCVRYEDYLTEKQSEKEELKKKVEKIIYQLKESTFFTTDNSNDISEEVIYVEDVEKQLKSLIGE